MAEGLLRIGELSRRTGLSPDVIRAWERRYDLLQPARTSGGFRLYSTSDLARLRLARAHAQRFRPGILHLARHFFDDFGFALRTEAAQAQPLPDEKREDVEQLAEDLLEAEEEQTYVGELADDHDLRRVQAEVRAKHTVETP